MADNKLIMELPHTFVTALSRARNGRRHELSDTQIEQATNEMIELYTTWNKTIEQLNALDVWWEEKKVEQHYKQSRWYYAHRKLRTLENTRKETWKRMFVLLTSTDGNYGQSFDTFGCIDPESIYNDFLAKYVLPEKI